LIPHLPKNGISGKWDFGPKPVSGKPTYQELASVQAYQHYFSVKALGL
jgi:hypothetical protein